jgi:hypothetical protein
MKGRNMESIQLKHVYVSDNYRKGVFSEAGTKTAFLTLPH